MNHHRIIPQGCPVKLTRSLAVVCWLASVTIADSVYAQTAISREDAPRTSGAASATEGKVLRHAVFFKFKDSASADDVNRIVDAFGALPSKIDSIVEYQAGENNSPQNLNDGLTHCFLLTFKDEAGRAAYLPHDDHKAFGSLVGPHLEKVFVIDYWASPQTGLRGNELKHLVFFKFKDELSAADLRAVEEAFAALPSKIDTVKAFEWGSNNSPEKHDEGFTHCFALTFGSDEDLAEYLTHPEHQAFVAKNRPFVEKVRVLDFWAKKSLSSRAE